MHALVQHGAKSFRENRAHAGKAFRDGVGAQHEHSARFVLAQRRTDSAGVAANQIHLQRANLLARNSHGSHFAEAGVDAVHGGIRFDQALYYRA
jgi:hypothetical protein